MKNNKYSITINSMIAGRSQNYVWLYLVQDKKIETNIKIGITTNLKSRVDRLQYDYRIHFPNGIQLLNKKKIYFISPTVVEAALTELAELMEGHCTGERISFKTIEQVEEFKKYFNQINIKDILCGINLITKYKNKK